MATTHGWVDCDAQAFEALDELAERTAPVAIDEDASHARLARADIFRLHAMAGPPIQIGGDPALADRLKRLLEMQPLSPLPPRTGMTSALREYQERGAQWLWFLYENRFGGLLCDDMGLGKTHQVMAFLAGLRETEQTRDPFLVVCPTSVLSHWERKLAEHAPGLAAAAYYGGQRDWARALVEKNAAAYDQYASGKWDLFTELLSECLDSGQKVVVYSQYLA